MAGTYAGSIKTKKTMIKKYGSYEAYLDHFRIIGKHGGSISRGGGFTNNPSLARLAGHKGGLKSKRSKMEHNEAGRAVRKDGGVWGSPRY